MAEPPTLEDLHGVRLAGQQVEVRRARSKVFAGIFGGKAKPVCVGRFEVQERLGAGGMGVVYAAFDPRLERRVALKVLRAEATDTADASRRLVAEARALAKLSHPNVITVYEVGEVEDQLYIAMELVSGYTLRSWLNTSPRKPEEILEVLRAAGGGLLAAHQAGLVHRDFKPENVLVSEDGDVYVTDFGLARPYATAPTISPSSRVTVVAGTPRYMAPEQIRGEVVDARADQFAWCVTAYEALVGELPFAESAHERFQTAEHVEPVIVPPGVRRSVRAVLERGLSPAREDRFDSMEDVLAAVRRQRKPWFPVAAVLAVGAVGVTFALTSTEERCPPRPEQLRGTWDETVRARVEEAFDATAMPYAERAWSDVEARLDVFAGSWVGAMQRACRENNTELERCLQRRRDALAPVVELLRDADSTVVEHATEVVGSVAPPQSCADPTVASELSVVDPRLDRIRASLLAVRLEDARALVEEVVADYEPGTSAWIEATTLRGDVALADGEGEQAAEAYEQVLDVASGERARTAVARAAVGLLRVQALLASTDFDATRGVARSASIAVAAAGNPPRLHARLLTSKASAAIARGEFDEALELVELAQSTLDELGVDTELEQAQLLHESGKALFRKQQLQDAWKLGERALAIDREVLGAEHPRVGHVLLLLGSVALVRGDLEVAEQHYREAERIFAHTVGSRHLDYATAKVSLANAARARGDNARARAATAEALAIMKDTLPEDNMRLLAVRLNLASLDHNLGHLEEARKAYLASLPTQEASLGDHFQVSMTLANLARVELELGMVGAARANARRAVEIRRSVFGEDHDRTLASRLLEAEVRLAGEPDAVAVLADVAEIQSLREAALGLTHPATLNTRLIRAKAELAAGRGEAALQSAEWVLEARRDTRPAEEVEAARVVVALAAYAAGRVDRARQAASVVELGDPLPSELRGWCFDCGARIEEIAMLR